MNGDSLSANGKIGLIHGSPQSASIDPSNILQALGVIHSPTTKNEIRKQASDYLESLKSNDDAVRYGVLLGSDGTQPPLVRHFGLSLIEHLIRHKLLQQSESQNVEIRNWVIGFGKAVSEKDPPFIRNKIAELWVELAKRSWALDWFELDQELEALWSGSLISKELVLAILENLSEDVFSRDDSAASLRGQELNNGLVEIFASQQDYAGGLKVKNQVIKLRSGDEGWLAKITQLLQHCSQHPGNCKEALLKCLATLRSALTWILTPAIIRAQSLSGVCACLSCDDGDILVAATDCLLALYGRSRLEDSDIKALVIPLCCTDNFIALRDLYRKSVVGVDQLESPQYMISKKLSEVISDLALLLMHTPFENLNNCNVSPFLELMLEICQHDSLIVSIPIVHAWAKTLGSRKWRNSPAVATCVGSLLDFASRRTLQYDLLDDDSEDPVWVFVNDEIELSTERSGFLTNYRKLCCQIIELICYTYLAQATPYLISQVDTELDKIQEIDKSFEPANFTKSQTSLQIDAQFSNVESAFRGFALWRSDRSGKESSEHEELHKSISEQIRAWSTDLLSKRKFKEPFAKQRMIKCVVEISNRALQQDNDFALKVLEHILTAFIPDQPEYEAYSDTVLELHMYAARELRHLALQHADYFVTFYDQLESKLRELSEKGRLSPQAKADLSATLFLVVQRASNIDDETRKHRLWTFLEPVSLAWQASGIQQAISSFESFSHTQCFDQVGPYLISINASMLENWSAIPLDANGTQLQTEMAERLAQMPLRLTRTLLANSTDKISPGSPVYNTTTELWALVLPHMVLGIFQVVSYTHQLHSSTSWQNVPSDKQVIISRVLRDRFWQSGITDGSKNDFYAMIKLSKRSLEGFASSVRNKLRLNIEQTYTILHSLSKLGETFYGVPQMAEALSEKLIATARPLSPHHYTIFLSMISKLIDDCPIPQREIFLGPVVPALLSELDHKCTTEWTKIENRGGIAADKSDDLTVEMREESLLRQFTNKAVTMVAFWIDHQREMQKSLQRSQNGPHANGATAPPPQRSMSSYVFSNPTIMSPLLLFYSHALSYRDTKSCAIVVNALKSLVLAFAARPTEQNASGRWLDDETTAAVREFISTEVLKAAITSLNDGYFADQQRELATLIATIWTSFGLPTHVAATETQAPYIRPASTLAVRNVLLSLPGLTEQQIDAAGQRLLEVGPSSHRQPRAVILALLEGFRGVRLSELGKIDMKAQKGKLMEKYLMRDSMGMQGMDEARNGGAGGEVDLSGVQEMFG